MTSIANDLEIISETPGLLNIMYFITLFVLLVTVIIITKILKVKFTKKSLKANKYLFYFVISILLIQFIFHYLKLFSAIKVIAYCATALFTYYLLAYLIVKNEKIFINFFKIVAFSSAILAIFSILSNLGFNNFLGLPFSDKSYYSFLGLHATGGIIDHPLTLGTQMIFGLGTSAYLFYINNIIKKKLIYAFLFILCSIGMVLSMARGSWLGLSVGIMFIILVRSKPKFLLINTIITLIIITVSLVALYNYAEESPVLRKALRIEQGASGREETWPFAWNLIYKNPILGYGFDSLSDLKWIYSYGKIDKSPDAGFHNNFLNMGLQSGLISSFFYLMLFIIPIYKLLTLNMNKYLKNTLIFISIAVFINVFFVTYSIGGLRSTSLSVGIFFGIANLENNIKKILLKRK
ncbi:MAG: O-antigen ligase family protein [Candidatus Helarchaeota archaeon]